MDKRYQGVIRRRKSMKDRQNNGQKIPSVPSYYPLVFLIHCFVCPSLIYAFLLPLGIFCPLFCLSFFDLRLLITPWYLLSIVFSVLNLFMPFYYQIIDKRYQGVIRGRKSMKDRQNNGQKIPRGNKKT
jgi:hypothetical protein